MSMNTQAQKLTERGEEALKKKNYDYAIEAFTQATMLAPDARRAREGLRKAELKKYENNYPSALARALLGLPAKMGMFFAGLGKKRNPDGYINACEKYLRIDPKSKAVNIKLGDCAAQAGYHETACIAYELAAEADPNDVAALKKLADLLGRTGKIQKALETLDRVVQLSPRDQDALKARKNLAARASLEETGFATAGSSRDLVKDKDLAGKLEKKERRYQTADDLAAQAAEVEEQLADDPDNIELWQDLAEVRQKQKDYDGAVEAIEKGMKVAPDNVLLQFQRDDLKIDKLEAEKMAAIQAGDQDKAQALDRQLLDVRTVAFRERVKAYPTDLNLRFKLGELLLQRGETEEAIGQFQQTVKDPKFRSESQLRLGRAFASKGQYDLAIRQLDQALEGQTGMTDRVKEIRYTLGEVYETKGQAEKAVEQFGMIYEVDIGFRDVGDRLAKLESGAGDGKLSLD